VRRQLRSSAARSDRDSASATRPLPVQPTARQDSDLTTILRARVAPHLDWRTVRPPRGPCLPLTGRPFSVAPGQTMPSRCRHRRDVHQARLVRLISGDPNPAGPESSEEPSPRRLQELPSRVQPVPLGSTPRGRSGVPAGSPASRRSRPSGRPRPVVCQASWRHDPEAGRRTGSPSYAVDGHGRQLWSGTAAVAPRRSTPGKPLLARINVWAIPATRPRARSPWARRRSCLACGRTMATRPPVDFSGARQRTRCSSPLMRAWATQRQIERPRSTTSRWGRRPSRLRRTGPPAGT
jgi:hypothetical protein